MRDVPWFLWWDGVQITEEELGEKLRSPDPAERAIWAARVMREARYQDVWRYLSVSDIVRDWPRIAPNLGRARALWTSLIDGWRRDGLLGA